MAWVQTAPREHRAPYAETEKFMVDVLKPTPGTRRGDERWAIVISFKLSFHGHLADSTVALQRLQNAWIALRWEQPGLAVVLDHATRQKVYTVPTQEDLQAWLSETFICDARSRDDICATLAPSAHARLFYLESSSEVILHVSHWRTDLRGSMLLMDRFFQLAASPADVDALRWGEEPANLIPGLEDVFQVPTESTPESQKYLQKAMAAFGAGSPTTRLNYKGDKTTGAGETRTLVMELSSDSTQLLRQAAKARGSTMFVALYTASVMLSYELASEDTKQNGMVSVIAADLRARHAAPYNGAKYAVSNWVSGQVIGLPYDPERTYDKLLQQLEREVRGLDYKGWLQGIRDYIGFLLGLFTTPMPAEQPLPAELQPSNVGICEDYVKHAYTSDSGSETALKVEDVRMGVDEPSVSILSHLWSWNGTLRISLVYNSSRWDDDVIKAAMNRLREITEEGLNIQLDVKISSG